MAKTIEQLAREIRQSWDDAAGDIAMNYEFDFGNEAMKKVYKAALKRTGSKQIARECIADHIHDDTGSIKDFVGDRIFDAVTQLKPGLKWGDPEWSVTFCAIAEATKQGSYRSWNTAMDQMIAEEKAYAKRKVRA